MSFCRQFFDDLVVNDNSINYFDNFCHVDLTQVFKDFNII